MLRNYFKVVEDFKSASTDDSGTTCDSTELLSVEKGDIIVDVKTLDDEWVLGKTILSQKFVKIPKRCVEELHDDGEKEPVESADKEADKEEDLSRRYSNISPIINRLSSVKDVKVSKDDEAGTSEAKAKAARPPRAPPRARKSQEMTNQTDSFRSRGSDEGYNSSSHYSGEKPVTNEPVVSQSGYCNANTSDAPLLSSFRESPNRFSSPRPSIQDEEGYEVPIFTPRSSVNGEIATADDKGVTLKFVFQRKSTAFDEKIPEGPPVGPREKISLNSIGENTENIYESWSVDGKGAKPCDAERKQRREKILIGLFIATSMVVSLGFFFVLFFLARFSPLLCFTIGVNVFALIFVALLTMGKQRWLCIATLLAPSLFSRKVKISFCLVLFILITAGPICNLSNNIGVVIRCNNHVSKNAGNTSDNAETPIKYQAARRTALNARTPLASKTPGKNGGFNANRTIKVINNISSTVLERCEKNFGAARNHCLPQEFENVCVKAMNTAVKSSVRSSCSREDKSCITIMFESRIEEICRNFNLTTSKLEERASDGERVEFQETGSINTFRRVILELLPLLLLLLLQEAYWYNRDYLSNKETDNVYITGKLKALDCNRKERGMRNKLFPLRKLEFRHYVLPSSFLQTTQETEKTKRWLITWIILGLSVLLAVLLDKYIHNALLFLLQNLQNKAQPCDMTLKELDINLIYAIALILALLFVFIIVQSYVLRSRSRICSYFYPKRESVRGVYLYYKILHERSHFWKACRERGKMLSEARRTRWKIGIGHRLFRSLPTPIRDSLEKLFVYRCMICNSLSCRKSFVCKDEECFATFCYECYIDMGQCCISCQPSGIRDSVFTSL